MDNLYLFLGVYIAVLLGTSYLLSKRGSPEQFLISGRNRRGWQLLLSKFAGSIGVGWFITYTAYAYIFGSGVFVILLGFIIGYVLFAYWAAPKIYESSKEKKFYTMGDYVYHVTKSRPSKLLVNLISIIYQSLWVLIGIVGGAKIMSHFGLLSYGWSVLITASIVLLYLLMAGHYAVIITDVIQAGIIIILLSVLSFSIINGNEIITLLRIEPGTLTFGAMVGFLLWGALSVFATSDRYQLCYAAKNVRTLKRGMGLAILPILFAAFLLLLIGLYMYSINPHLDSAIVFLEALKLHLPVALIPVSFVLFFAGLMSSADTGIYSITSHYVFSKKNRNPVKDIKLATIILVPVLASISLIFQDIVEITLLTAAITLTLSIPMIYLFLGKSNSKKFVSSVFCGIIGTVIGISVLGLSPGAAIFVLIGGLLGLVYPSGTQRNKLDISP